MALFLVVQCVNIFGVDVSTKNLATRIHDGKARYGWKPQMARKPTVYSPLVGDPGYFAEFGLDCYLIGDIKQFAISVRFLHAYVEFPGVLPMGSRLTIKTKDQQDVTSNIILTQAETKYVLLPIGHDETTCWGYFPISEDDIQRLSMGVDQISFDYEYYNGVSVVTEKVNLKESNFSKKISGYYKSICKKEAKLKKQNISIDASVRDFLNFDRAAVILLYHGYRFPVFLYEKYLEYSGNSASKEAYKDYQLQKETVQSIFNAEFLRTMANTVEKQAIAYSSQMQAAVSNMNNQLQQLGAQLQQERAQKAAIEKAKVQQQFAAMKAHWAEQRAQAKLKEEAKQKEESNRIYGGSNSLIAQMEAEKNRSQNRSMESSDLSQYNAAKMSDAIYGTAATNQALAQQRQYDAQQNQQVLTQQRQINQQQMQQAQSQQSYSGSTVNAVTSSGSHVQIKVNGNQVMAYSSGNNIMGPEWNGVIPAAAVQETSSPISQVSTDIASRFAYQASVPGLGMVYWGTPMRRVINDAPSGSPVKAVTQNGQTLTIMVNGNKVVAYGSGLNQASDIQWHSILPNANVAETNSSFDGEFASRFSHKANIPSIGTVYF